jgi:hypothetical protein
MIPPINGWTFETISKFFQEQNSAVARLNLALELTTQNSEKFSLVPVHHPYGSKFLKFKVINVYKKMAKSTYKKLYKMSL